MKFGVIILCLIFLIQGQTVTLFSDLFEYTHLSSTISHTCHDQSPETESNTTECEDCFHIHTCCHVKVVQSQLKYEFQTSFDVQRYLEFLNVIISPPIIDGPFQPPKTV